MKQAMKEYALALGVKDVYLKSQSPLGPGVTEDTRAEAYQEARNIGTALALKAQELAQNITESEVSKAMGASGSGATMESEAQRIRDEAKVVTAQREVNQAQRDLADAQANVPPSWGPDSEGRGRAMEVVDRARRNLASAQKQLQAIQPKGGMQGLSGFGAMATEYARPHRGFRGLGQDEYNFDEVTVIATPGVGDDAVAFDPGGLKPGAGVDLYGPLTPVQVLFFGEGKHLPPALRKFMWGTVICAALYFAFKGGRHA